MSKPWKLERRYGHHWCISSGPSTVAYDLNLVRVSDDPDVYQQWQWMTTEPKLFDPTYQTFRDVNLALVYADLILDWLNDVTLTTEHKELI
jgi:hypothetical protein